MSDELIQRLQNTSAIDEPMEARRLMDACVIALRSAVKDRAHIASLQKALAYWMPDVTDDRSASDAMLLCGYMGEQEASWGQQQVERIGYLTAELEAARQRATRCEIALDNARGFFVCYLDKSMSRNNAENLAMEFIEDINAALSASSDGAPQPMTQAELDAQSDWIKNARPPEKP